MPLGPPSVIEGQTRCILFSVFWVSPRCPTLWMSLGKTFSGICLGRYSKHPKSLQTSKLLTPAPLLNLYQYLCWCLVLFNLFKFDLYCFKSLKGMFKKKNRPHSSLLREANHPEHGRIIIY